MGRIVGFNVGKCLFEMKLSAEVTTTQLAFMQPRTQQGEIILHFEWEQGRVNEETDTNRIWEERCWGDKSFVTGLQCEADAGDATGVRGMTK